MKWIGFFVLAISILYLSSPFLGMKTREKKIAYREELRTLDLNQLCAGTLNCTPQEMARQEKEEQKIIQGFQDYF